MPFNDLTRLSPLASGLIGGGVTALPVLFSSLIFANIFQRTRETAAALGSNILGGLFGGALEALSIFLGIRTMALLAMVVYGVAPLSYRSGANRINQHGLQLLFGQVGHFISGGTYSIFGYEGKQVRDSINSHDVVRAIEEFAANPRCGEVYNLGGGRENSISMLEAIRTIEQIMVKKMSWKYVEENRKGDHICYISDLAKFKSHYPTGKSLLASTKSSAKSSPTTPSASESVPCKR